MNLTRNVKNNSEALYKLYRLNDRKQYIELVNIYWFKINIYSSIIQF